MGTEECDIAEIEMRRRTQDVDREKQEGGNIGGALGTDLSTTIITYNGKSGVGPGAHWRSC